MLYLRFAFLGKDIPITKPPSPQPKVTATPTYTGSGMPATPSFNEPPPTPKFPSSATPMSVSSTPLQTAPTPSTPLFGAETPSTGDLFGAFMTPKNDSSQKEPEPEVKQSPPKRSRGRPPRKTSTREDDSTKAKPAKSEDIMDIVSNVTKNISSTFEKSNEEAPFELTWTGPIATPSSMDMFASPSNSMLPPYTPMSTPGATPFSPPSMPNRTPFNPPGIKTPFATPGSGGATPFVQPGGKTPLQARSVTELSKQGPDRSPAQTISGNREEEGKKRRPVSRKKVGAVV